MQAAVARLARLLPLEHLDIANQHDHIRRLQTQLRILGWLVDGQSSVHADQPTFVVRVERIRRDRNRCAGQLGASELPVCLQPKRNKQHNEYADEEKDDTSLARALAHSITLMMFGRSVLKLRPG